MGFPEAMSPDLQQLLESSSWVRNLARSLVGDAQTADDLVQDAWVVALERGPDGVRGPGLRRWLAAVMRNLASDRRRGEGRRGARERAVARPDVAPGEHDAGHELGGMLERLETHRTVVDAVRSLDEPYRTAVLMRYFEGLTPPEIARKLDVPVRTVHSRLHRALGKLRERLKSELGGPESLHGGWLLALLPLAQRADGAGTIASTAAAATSVGTAGGALTGALIMDAKLKLALAGVAVVGVAAVAAYSMQDSAPAEPVVAAAPVEPDVELSRPEAAPAMAPATTVEPRRVAAVEEPDVAGEPVEPASPAHVMESLRGRVIDAERNPVAGVVVEMLPFGAQEVPEGARVRSEGDGTFTMEARHLGDVTVADDRYTTLLQPTLFRQSDMDDELVLVVAPRQTVAGVVVDASGAPLPGAEVTIDLKDEFHASLGYALDHSKSVRWTRTTDAEGRFTLDNAPRTDYGLLITQRAGFARDIRELPLDPVFDLEIVMGEPDDDRFLLEGLVVDQGGQPVEGAYVACEFQNGKTDAQGRFSLELSDQDERGVLMAIKHGMLPARVERVGDSNVAPKAWPDPLVLRLGGPPLTIAGRVVDVEGEPIAGAKVWTSDTTHFGAVEHENFGPRMTVATSVEALLNGKGFSTTKVTTDDDGRFELLGLIDKEYTVSVHDEATLAFLRTDPIAAGSQGLLVELDVAERHERIAGRVVDPDGDPVAGAEIALCRSLGEINNTGYRDALETSSVRTDEEGRFEFKNVAAPITHARVHGPDLDLDNYPLIDETGDLEELELVVARRCHVRVELLDPSEADEFGLLGDSGEPSMLTTFRGNLGWSSPRTSLASGQSETLTASEAARTLVLYKDGVEVRRVEIQLEPGDVNVLQP